MAKANQIKALVQSHVDGDDSRFYAIAMQVAAQAARIGHGIFAQELKELVDHAKLRSKEPPLMHQARTIPMAQPRGELAGLLTATYPTTRVADMALEDSLRQRINRVILEQRQRERIREHGFTPLHKLLLVGNPGTGKTMTASALAGELGLPLFTIQLDGLITKYMGETAAKLRLVFDSIQSSRGVYLFDEFDSLGGQRGSGNDVGEIRRVLNSFLQFLELDDSDSLIIGATNHAQLLDRALFRRFDAVFEYGMPSKGISTQVMRARLSLMDTGAIDWSSATDAAETLSHADITSACEQAAKNAILENAGKIQNQVLITALMERRHSHN